MIENSAIGLRCRIGADAKIRNSVLMGADYYDPAVDVASHQADGTPPLGIGSGAVIEAPLSIKTVGSATKLEFPIPRSTSRQM